jgi:hypothetical protein
MSSTWTATATAARAAVPAHVGTATVSGRSQASGIAAAPQAGYVLARAGMTTKPVDTSSPKTYGTTTRTFDPPGPPL